MELYAYLFNHNLQSVLIFVSLAIFFSARTIVRRYYHRNGLPEHREFFQSSKGQLAGT